MFQFSKNLAEEELKEYDRNFQILKNINDYLKKNSEFQENLKNLNSMTNFVRFGYYYFLLFA